MRAAGIIMLAVCVLTAPMAQSQPQLQESYPVPVSEYAEKTGPNTMTFLAYPKYYKLADGALELVNTNLVASKSEDWDYEVMAGIWQLFVRADGTFQARHEGDIFAYRFAGLGVGRGANYKLLELGKLNWENISVVGDSVRWSEVLPNVDVTVRYIHDILKVDVKVKQALMANLRAQTKAGALDAGEFLTARFEIPQALVTSQAMQNGEARDIYAEPISVDQPLYFEKDGKDIHKMRPVEAYVLDAKGESIEDRSISIQTAQQWRLSQAGPGVAEMSARLGDLANAPDGDVVIDPSMVFSPGKDTMLKDSTIRGSYTTCDLDEESRLLFAFDVSSLGSGKSISSVYLYLYDIWSGISSSTTSAAYKATNYWLEGIANWYNRAIGLYWTSSGGDYDSNCYSPSVTLPTTNDKWIVYNITTPFNSHYSSSISDVNNNGFLVRTTATTGSYITIVMKEYATVSKRPRLSVVYRGTMFGADVGHANLTPTPLPSFRIQKAKDDNLKIIRLFEGDSANETTQAQYFRSFAQECSSRGEKLILVFEPANYKNDGMVNGPTNFKNHIQNILENASYPVRDFIENHTIAAIQIGNEEEGKWGYEQPPTPTPATTPSLDKGEIYYAGCDYAVFYLNARDYLKSNWPYLDIIGGCIVDDKALGYTTSQNPIASKTYIPTPYRRNDNGKSSYAFLNGFVQEVLARQTPGPSTDKLPDIIDFHGYTGNLSAEHKEDYTSLMPSPTPQKGTHEWIERMDQLQDIFDYYNYRPRYIVTEWGFSADENKGNGCNDANEKTQAVYYLRRALMDATMRRDKNNIVSSYLECSVYWQHYYNNADNNGDTMWYRDPFSTVPRHIQQIGDILHDEADSSYPGLQNAIAWKIAKSDRMQIIDNPAEGYENTMMCGWINAAGVRWGAIWRYRWNDTSYWTPTSAANRSFEILASEISPTITPGPAYLYKFDVPATPQPTPSPIWKQVSLTPIQPVRTPGNSTWYYPIPGQHVNENPVLLKFQN